MAILGFVCLCISYVQILKVGSMSTSSCIFFLMSVRSHRIFQTFTAGYEALHEITEKSAGSIFFALLLFTLEGHNDVTIQYFSPIFEHHPCSIRMDSSRI